MTETNLLPKSCRSVFDGTSYALVTLQMESFRMDGLLFIATRFMMKPDRDQLAGTKTTEPKFSMKRVAELIGVHVSTVSRLMDSCELGYYQIGKRRIVGESHLEKYLSMTERKAKTTPIH